MTSPAFTILLPVVRPPALLPYAMRSVLAQERQDFELFVICDGAPPETVSCARAFAANDTRIRVFEHPKGEHYGEYYRDRALQEASGEYVCHIGDDDLWLPNHLSEMAALLRNHDFGNLSHVEVSPDGRGSILAGNLANDLVRRRMMSGSNNNNFFGLTLGGYRLSAYRALHQGWSPPPPGVASDLAMWRKFLSHEGLRCGTRIAVTAMKFSAGWRRDQSLDQRQAEIATWAQQISDPEVRDRFAQVALLQLSQTVYQFHLHAKDLKARAEAQANDLKARAEAQAAQERAARMETMNVANRLRGRLQDATARIAKLRGKVKAMKATRSWRFTRPLRRLAKIIAR